MLRIEVITLENDLATEGSIKLKFPDPNSIMNFDVTIKITEPESLWYPATYAFRVTISPNYPYEPPKCICQTKVTMSTLLNKILY